MNSASSPTSTSPVTKAARVQRIPVRGLDYQVLTWGDPRSPRIFLLHGWMDVGASFQFLVDALAGDWFAIAPDWRGFGHSAWAPQGYWFPDYVADLEALADAFAPGEALNLVGHSLGGNVAMHYAGVRPERVRAVVSLEGFGIPVEGPERAPDKLAAWLDALASPPGFAPYPSLQAVARRLQKNSPGLSGERALWLARHWADELPDGTARLNSDPRHKLPFPTVYRFEEASAIWRRIAAPVLWAVGLESHFLTWLGPAREGDATDGCDVVRRRLAEVPRARLATIPGAGHMLHLDRPAEVAVVVAEFLRAPR